MGGIYICCIYISDDKVKYEMKTKRPLVVLQLDLKGV
jgi:hypothetical protein